MSNKNKLDAYVKELRRKQYVVVSGILFVALVFVWITSPNAGSVREVSGAAVRAVGVPGGSGKNKLYVVVKLDSGNEVRVEVDTLLHYKVRALERLNEQLPLTIGAPSYLFMGYVDENG